MKKFLSLLIVLAAITAASFLPAQARARNNPQPAIGYRVEIAPNERVRVFHFNTRINVYDDIETDVTGVLLDRKHSKLYNRLATVKGVDFLSIQTYEVTIGIGEAFDWADLQPEILQAFSAVIGELTELPPRGSPPEEVISRQPAQSSTTVECPTVTPAVYKPPKKGFHLFRRVGRFLF